MTTSAVQAEKSKQNAKIRKASNQAGCISFTHGIHASRSYEDQSLSSRLASLAVFELCETSYIQIRNDAITMEPNTHIEQSKNFQFIQ